MAADRRPLRAFVSYAHEDEPHRLRLEKSLKLLERQGLLETWSDRRIEPGEEWRGAIASELNRADLVLLLVSDDFLASDYCWDVEVRRALERHREAAARVVPIVVRAAAWTSAPFGELQALPKDARAITSWPNEDEAWADVAKRLRALVEGMVAEASGADPPGGAGPSGGGEPDPRRYLEALRESSSYLEIRGMGAQVAERLPLERVYTRLRVASRGRGSTPERESHRGERDQDLMHRGETTRALPDVLAEHSHAVLIGDPGSGKTTFLRFAAQVLCGSLINGDPEPARRKLGLGGEVPFPIFVRLADVAAFLSEHPDGSTPEEAPEHFYRYLDHSLKGRYLDLPPRYLRRRLLGGGCYLLLDGLDEVPLLADRRRISRLVEHVVAEGKTAGNGGNRHLLTCRTRAYEEHARLATLDAFRLNDFEPAQVEEFVASWSQALHRVGTAQATAAAEAEAQAYASRLRVAIDSHPRVGPLTANPLMLTMLAVVHWNERRLPEDRAELYEAAVKYLLEKQSRQSEERGFGVAARRLALQAVAMRMFEHPAGVRRTLGRHEAAAAAKPLLGVGEEEALEFLEAEALHSGLLVTRAEGEVEFWHLTFQEYLAARELAKWKSDSWQRLAPHLFDERWHEVVLLLAGRLMREQGHEVTAELITRILDASSARQSWLDRWLRPFKGTSLVERARAVGLIARILAELPRGGGDPSAGTGYREALGETLALFEPGGTPAPESLRVEVGEALGQAGDPRLVGEERLWVDIPGGALWMGAQKGDPKAPAYDPEAYDDESPVHRVTLSPFQIGRYPVTVEAFRAFVAAGEKGYLNPRLWDSTGWAWREKEGLTEPGSWRQQLQHRNRPVTGVSWYEADAYCRWAGVELPTEAQWERAARGLEGRKYPWGDEKPGERPANFAGRNDNPTPVGSYPGGSTPEGVYDLAGNVLEWCRDWFGAYPDGTQRDPTGPENGSSRVLRGGAFNYFSPGYLRGAYRYDYHPEIRFVYFGFRVVRVSPGGLDLDP